MAAPMGLLGSQRTHSGGTTQVITQPNPIKCVHVSDASYVGLCHSACYWLEENNRNTWQQNHNKEL